MRKIRKKSEFSFSNLPVLNFEDLCWIDVILLAVMAAFCYFSFSHGDLLVTGNRSWLMYDGILDFYDASYEFAGDHGANYLPSTFWLFAIWNLPLKLLGVTPPTYIEHNRLIYMLWYKLLPVTFYVFSGLLMYRLACQIGMSKSRAKTAMYIFLTCPLAFFSQLIFSQYDIFAVFFMLLGMQYYFRDEKGDWWIFCAMFGLALTFKYFVLLIFLILILLREKKVSKLIKAAGVMVIPFALECAIYFWSDGFQQGVFGFKALSFVTQADFEIETGSASFCKILCVVLLIWAYFVEVKDRKDTVDWALYLSCGICFVLFGLMTWNPQWLVFAAPFWTLSMLTSKHTEKFLWLEVALVPFFYSFVTQAWRGAVDNDMLNQGIWKYLIEGKMTVNASADYLLPLDKDTLFSVLVGLFLAFFVFKHPRFCSDWVGKPIEKTHIGLIRTRAIAAVLLFVIPAGICVFDMHYNHYVALGDVSRVQYKQITNDKFYEQLITGQSGKLESVYVYMATYDRVNYCDLRYEIVDKTLDEVVVSGELESKLIENEAYCELDCNEILLDEDHTYAVSVYSMDADEWNCVALGFSPDTDTKDQIYCVLDGNTCERNLSMVLKFVQ